MQLQEIEHYTSLDAWKLDLIDGHEVCQQIGNISVSTQHVRIAKDLLLFLNKHVHVGGHWRVVWVCPAPYRANNGLFIPNLASILECQWLDDDGDVNVVVEVEKPMRMYENMEEMLDLAGMCTAAWMSAQEHLLDVGVQDWQKRKLSQGEPSVDPTAEPEL